MLRGLASQNGLKAWRALTKDLQPRTRQRSLALIQSLDLMVGECEKSANVTCPDDLKIALVMAACRVHRMALHDLTGSLLCL